MALRVPTLRTDRLKLEPISTLHSDGMFALWSDASVCEYSGTINDYDGNVINMPARNKAESDCIIDFWLRAFDDGWGFRWAIIVLEDNSFAGTIGFNSLDSSYEIAFHLLPLFWGRGIMTEAAKKAIQWSIDDGALEIEAFIEKENSRSSALARRLEMVATHEYSEGAQRYFKKLDLAHR
ncbi:MAG: GNAT family N-acetyltransferase [Pseudomonadota bacterium]